MSRQADHHRQRNVEALRERAAAAPLVVGYDAEWQKFVVRWLDDPDTVLIAARHEVVAAYIEGFVRAWINRPLTPLVLAAGECTCRTPGCGHPASEHRGPGGACLICDRACWS